jgi:hypothetical protein
MVYVHFVDSQVSFSNSLIVPPNHEYTDGRLEDGYLAWSSMYFHEWFGYTIYTPLTEDEQEAMRKDPSNVPNWMNEFTSLPNIAIPLSYFCIGIALQLLRTPLIVYFIEDQNATPAEVNVLFTVSKWKISLFYAIKLLV